MQNSGILPSTTLRVRIIMKFVERSRNERELCNYLYVKTFGTTHQSRNLYIRPVTLLADR